MQIQNYIYNSELYIEMCLDILYLWIPRGWIYYIYVIVKYVWYIYANKKIYIYRVIYIQDLMQYLIQKLKSSHYIFFCDVSIHNVINMSIKKCKE